MCTICKGVNMTTKSTTFLVLQWFMITNLTKNLAVAGGWLIFDDSIRTY